MPLCFGVSEMLSVILLPVNNLNIKFELIVKYFHWYVYDILYC